MHKGIFFLLFCGAMGAQDLRFAGPVSGFVYDAPARSIRVIQGIPGSSYLGTRVLQNLDFASIAPNGSSALVWSGGVAAFVPRLDNGAVAHEIGAAVVPDRIAWSADSRAAVLYRSAEPRLERWRNLDEAPVIDTPDALRDQGAVTFIAVDSSASRIVLGAPNGFVLWSEGQPAQALPFAGATGAVFAADGKTLFLAGPDRIAALENLDSGVYLEPGAHLSSRRHFPAAKISRPSSPNDTPLDAAGLVVDRAGAHVYVADRSSRSVLVYDIAGAEVTDAISLDVAPSTMLPLLRPGTFLLNARTGADDPVWVMDTNGRNMAYFVGMGIE